MTAKIRLAQLCGADGRCVFDVTVAAMKDHVAEIPSASNPVFALIRLRYPNDRHFQTLELFANVFSKVWNFDDAIRNLTRADARKTLCAE